MHSTLVRAQNVFGFFTSVAFAVGLLIALSDLISPRTPSASVSLSNVQVARGRPHYYSTKKEEYAHIRFNLDADFSSLFTWNTKQLFVYVTAEWPSTTSKGYGSSSTFVNTTNEAVIWDTIITSPSADYLSTATGAARKKLLKSGEGLRVDPSRGKMHLENQKPKYQITSPAGRLAATPGVTLRVHYNVQPWVGALTWTPGRNGGDLASWKPLRGGVSAAFDMPELKRSKKEQEEAAAAAAGNTAGGARQKAGAAQR